MLSKIIFTSMFVLIALSTNISKAQESLYKRLGGYDAIAAVTDDFIGRLATNDKMAKFLVGLNDDSKAKFRQHLVDFICNKTGGPCLYVGRDMKTSHKGLGINEEEWNVGAGLLVESLNHFKVPKAEMDEFLAFVVTLHDDIVEKK